MSRDRYERRHRRTAAHPDSVAFMASADMERVPSLSAATGIVRCIHAGTFPCAQCTANRKWNEAAGIVITEAEFERQYADEELTKRIAEEHSLVSAPPERPEGETA